VTSDVGIVGQFSGGDGTATVDGTNSLWAITNTLTVGQSSLLGTVNVQAGGKITSATGIVGYFANGAGTVTVTGTASEWALTGVLSVGRDNGTGTLNIQSGGKVTSNSASIGGDSGTGTATVNNSTWNNSTRFDVGAYFDGFDGLTGTGSLSVTNSGTVNNTSGSGLLKVWAGGTLTIDGGTVNVKSFEGVSGRIVNFHDGTLNVNNGSFVWGATTLTIDGDTGAKNPKLILNNVGTVANFDNINVGSVNKGELQVLGNTRITATSGLTRVTNGSTLTIDGGTINTRSFQGDTGRTINFRDGNLNVGSGGTFTWGHADLTIAADTGTTKNPTLRLHSVGTVDQSSITVGDAGKKGTLLVNGTTTLRATTATGFVVKEGGLLGGTGTIGSTLTSPGNIATVQAGGAIRGGSRAVPTGILTVQGGLTLEAGSTLKPNLIVGLDNSDGMTNSMVSVTGSNVFNISNLNGSTQFRITLESSDVPLATNFNIRLVNLGTSGNVHRNGSSVGTNFTFASTDYEIAWTQNDVGSVANTALSVGNDGHLYLSFSFNPVPEPEEILLWASLVMAVGYVVRRRVYRPATAAIN
jgi:fibronectin-binding autotransporter adhesin